MSSIIKLTMKRIRIPLLALAMVALCGHPGWAAGLLKPIGAGADAALGIRSHRVEVTINNGFVRTEVDQVFANSGASPIEGIYSFPLPKQASLSELSLWVAGREILGEVVERERARKIYAEQQAQGQQVALAEQHDYKAFDVRVGNIPAQSDTRVRLVYYQPMVIDQNIGRYLYPLAEGNVDDQRIAFWSVDDRVSGPFSFHLQLKSAFPIKDVRLPGLDKEAVVSTTAADEGAGTLIDVTIDRPEGSDLGRDIVFYYRLDDQVPARIELIPYKAQQEEPGTFMLVVTPAADLQPIAEGVDWTFVLDTSGSMGGHKIATLTAGVSRVLAAMRPADRFRIITFNNSSQELTSGYVAADPEQVRQWSDRIRALPAGGGTNLFAGLEQAYRKFDDDRTTGVILVTDGVANVGRTEQRDFLELLKKYDVRLFTFVIGNSANQPLLERLAKDSGGFAMNISTADDISGRLLQAKSKVLHQNLHDVEIVIDGERVSDVTPQQPGNLYLGQQLVQLGRYQGTGEVNIRMRGKVSGQQRQWQTRAVLPEIDRDNPELERIWALAKIDELMARVRDEGETEALRQQITELGLRYSLVTDYTSMLVVSDDVLEREGLQQHNAERVQRERAAQQQRAAQPATNYRVDTSATSTGESSQGAFGNRPAPGIGSGPVGLLVVPLVAWLKRRKQQ